MQLTIRHLETANMQWLALNRITANQCVCRYTIRPYDRRWRLSGRLRNGTAHSDTKTDPGDRQRQQELLYRFPHETSFLKLVVLQ